MSNSRGDSPWSSPDRKWVLGVQWRGGIVSRQVASTRSIESKTYTTTCKVYIVGKQEHSLKPQIITGNIPLYRWKPPKGLPVVSRAILKIL